jgi:hypothetical protein
MGAGAEMAERFIGFGPGDQGEYCNQAPADVDLSHFQITGSFDRGYDYAFRPSVMNTLGEHEVQNLFVFMLGTPRAGGMSSGGETHTFMTADGFCQTACDTVNARWKLEWDTAGAESHTFTTRELALLANMTEGAVRNALADKSDNGLQAVPGTKNPVIVEHAEALRWLKGRRGFIPTPDRPCVDRFLTEHLQKVQSTAALGQLIGRRLSATFGSQDKAPAALSWSAAEVDVWVNGTQAFEEERARTLAQALDLDVPLFVGKALEVTLRRDLTKANAVQL